jgi:hypothetical protein
MLRRDIIKLTAALAASGAASGESTSLSTTSRRTHKIQWTGGGIELNLEPMNPQVAAVAGMPIGYVQMRPEVSLLLPVADLVGIVSFQLQGMDRVPRILWDNREHQFWEGFEGSFEPRNTVVNEPKIEQVGESRVRASYYYIANHVRTSIGWEFSPPSSARYKANWTTTIRVENLTGKKLSSYLQFFACYHPRATNYYWDSSNEIKPCSTASFNAVRDDATKRRMLDSPYTVHKNRNLKGGEVLYARYAKPVILSGTASWFGDCRHVIMIEPDYCATLATWYEQARDYTLCPASGNLQPGEQFRVRIRHVVAPVSGIGDLERLWEEFEHELDSSRPA